MRALVTVMALATALPMFAQSPPISAIKPPPEAVTEVLPPPTESPVPALITEVPPPKKQWSGGIDFGLNGTSGNSDSMNFRLFANTKREWENKTFTADALYNYAAANGTVNQDNFLSNARQEWAVVGTPWSCFVSGGLQYDTFRAFDLLVFSHTGVGYAWWKDDTGFLKTRAGVGGSFYIGGPDDDFHPEGLLGLDYEKKIAERTKFVFNGVLYPDLNEFFEYRATVATHLEFLISPEYNLGLKVGAVDNYISQPGGRKPNDLNYYMALTWKY